jgi:hypothetical protein
VAIRSRAVRPDAVLETAVGGIPHVTDEAFIRAVVDAATTLCMVGGELRIVLQRVPTEFANESLTAAALIEWRNHTEAKAQPEPHVAPRAETGELFFSDEPVDDVSGHDRETRDEVRELDEADVDDQIPTAAR